MIGHELLTGRPLYADLWDHKPPAVHVAFAAAAAVTGYGPDAVLLLNVVVALLTMLGAFAAASAATGRRDAGVVAAALWAVVGADLGLQANQPNTEVFINACLVWAIAAVLGGRSSWRRWPAGLLFALASLFKPIAAVVAAIVGVAHVLQPPAGRGAAVRDVASWAIVGAAAWGGVAALFAAGGHLQAFSEAVFAYNRDYAGEPLRNLLRGLRPSRLLPTYVRPMLGLVTVAALGLAASARTARRPWSVLAAWGAATAVAVALPGFFLPHYYQLWLPVFVVAAALGLAGLHARIDGAGDGLFAVAGAILVVVTALPQLPTIAMSADEWSRAKYGDEFVRTRDAAVILDELLEPNERFYNLGAETGLYLYTRRSPPTGLFYHYPMERGPLAESLAHGVAVELERSPPEAIVVSGNVALPVEHPVRRLIEERWVAIPSALDELRFELRVLPGTALAARLSPSGYGDSSPQE